MRTLHLVAAATPILISTYFWLSYYLPIKVSQFYHMSYFGFALLPAVLVSALILLAGLQRTWLRIICGILAVPGLLLWLLSVSVVANNFKIH